MASTNAEEPRKKRRQNVACDSCKLRRIKCDLLELLTPNETDPSSSTAPPLHVLVRENPDVSCTNCRSKGLKCTTQQIINPTRPNKGGKRIEEARKAFGTDDPHINGDGQQRDMPDFGQSGLLSQFNLSGGAGPSGHQFDSSGQNANTTSTPFPNPFLWMPSQTPVPPSNTAVPFPAQPPSGPIPGQIDPMADFWSRWTGQEPISSQDSSPAEAHLDPHLDSHTSSHTDPALPTFFGKYNPFKDRFEPEGVSGQEDPPDPSPRSTQSAKPPRPHHSNGLSRPTQNRSPLHSEQINLESIDNDFEPIIARKRARTTMESVSPMNEPDDEDPWHFYAQNRQVVRWGRKELVQETLADRALGIELSRHLVRTFFQSIHLSMPVVSPESFYLEWDRAGQRSDYMTPAQEVLCAVIEAWGARYSDSPVVLGLRRHEATSAPKVITADGRFLPGTQARLHWGRSRETVCNALVDRVYRLLDIHGIYRKPSVTGVQALTLFSQLMHMSEVKGKEEEHFLQNMLIQGTIMEQMKVLGLMWNSQEPIISNSDELPVSLPHMKMKQRRLFWTSVVSDAFWAGASGVSPRIAQSEVDSAGEWLQAIADDLPTATFRVLVFFMKQWFTLTEVGRRMQAEISGVTNKKGTVDVPAFCKSVRELMEKIQGVASAMLGAADLLDSCDHDLLGFSPINYIANIRLSCPFLLLILREQSRDMVRFHKSLFSQTSRPLDGAFIYDETRHSDNVAMLEKVHMQAVDVLLHSCRSQMGMFKALMPTGLIQTAAVMIRVLVATAQFLAEVPTNEQGYPSDTLGGYGWTWEAKQQEVGQCVEALYQIGWAWSDVGDVLGAIMLAMERLEPPPSVLQAYQRNLPEVNPVISAQKALEVAQEAAIMRSALQYWPPKSIPTLLEAALSRKKLEDDPAIAADVVLMHTGGMERDMDDSDVVLRILNDQSWVSVSGSEAWDYNTIPRKPEGPQAYAPPQMLRPPLSTAAGQRGSASSSTSRMSTPESHGQPNIYRHPLRLGGVMPGVQNGPTAGTGIDPFDALNRPRAGTTAERMDAHRDPAHRHQMGHHDLQGWMTGYVYSMPEASERPAHWPQHKYLPPPGQTLPKGSMRPTMSGDQGSDILGASIFTVDDPVPASKSGMGVPSSNGSSAGAGSTGLSPFFVPGPTFPDEAGNQISMGGDTASSGMNMDFTPTAFGQEELQNFETLLASLQQDLSSQVAQTQAQPGEQ